MITRHPLVEPALLAFTAAARSLQLAETRIAIALLVAIDDTKLRQHFDQAGDEWRRRHKEQGTAYPDSIEKASRDKTRMPSQAGQTRIFDRDLWHCRWCGSPVISLRAVHRMHKAVGAAYPHGAGNANHHGLTVAAGASLDHVIPHALGGANDDSNFVTACWPCQFARGNDSIDRIGLTNPTERQPVATFVAWDGCDWFG